jgi:hypothetical protein
MNKNRTRILLACIATGAALASPAVAKADDTTFLYDVRAQGFTSSNYTLLNAGYGVCIAFANGANGVDVARYIYTHTDWSVSQQDAAMFVITATENLCNQFDHRSQGAVA